MDSLGDIQTYKVQLEQVEAALVSEPDNEELVKLKADLLDIISLTEDLMGLSNSKTSKQEAASEENISSEPEVKKRTFTSLYDDEDDVGLEQVESSSKVVKEDNNVNNEDGKVQVTVPGNLVPKTQTASAAKVDIIDEKERQYRQQLQELKMMTMDWKPGDTCQALNSESNQFHEAEILCKGEGYLQVKYNDSGRIANVLLSDVRKLKKRRWGESTAVSVAEVRAKQLDKEKKKKKKQNKKQRATEIEQAKEAEKKSWLSFMKANKTIKKSQQSKSIFASPDNFDGKIGIGTCGISGKGMTNFTTPDKYKR